MLKQLVVLFFLAAAVFAEKAYFAMETYGNGREFIVELTKDEDIKHARELVSGETRDRPHILGRIKKTVASYNPNYSFYLDPNTVSFFDHGIEVCDADLPYVEDHLDEACGAFLPGCIYCPWSSRLTKEVKI